MKRDITLYLAGVVTGCSLLVALGATSRPAETIRAREFILEDSTGAQVGRWSTNRIGVVFAMGAEGEGTVSSFAGMDGGTGQPGTSKPMSHMSVRVPNESSATLGAARSSYVSVYDRGNPRATLSAGYRPDDSGRLELFEGYGMDGRTVRALP